MREARRRPIDRSLLRTSPAGATTSSETSAKTAELLVRTLSEDGIRLVRTGVTSVDELMRVVDVTDRMA